MKLVRTILLLSTAVIVSASARTALTVTAAPAPPVVDAGPAKIIAFPATDLTLFGHATDPNNDPLTAQWTLTDGPAPIGFSAPWGLATTVTFTTAGTYTFQLAVSDGTFNVTNSTTVTVNPASSQTEFYVDPTYTGSVETGDAATPWKTLIEADRSSYYRWGTINAALAAGPVIIYFSARNAGTDTAEEIVGSVRVRRTDRSTNRLTLDGMSRYNTNDDSPSWVDYAGSSRMRIRVPSGCCSLSIGWYSLLSGDGKLDYVTLRGFEVTGSGARITWGGSYSVLEYIWSHDVTDLGATVQFDAAVKEFPDCRDLGISHDITVRNNIIERGIGEGIYIAGNYNYEPDGGCVSGPNAGDNHYDILIENNFIRDPGLNGNEGDGIDLKAGLYNVTVRGNNISFTHSGGGDCTGGDGIVTSGQMNLSTHDSNYLIENNTIHGGGCFNGSDASNGLALGGLHSATIRNNIIYNIPNTGITASTRETGSTPNSQRIRIYNNTVYAAAAGLSFADFDDAPVVRNNLLLSNGVSIGWSPFSIDSDYNLLSPTGSRVAEGSHSIVLSDPTGVVANPASGDFNLIVRSPAIGIGVDLSPTGFATDISGNLRPSAAWSTGAREFVPSAFPVISAMTADVYDAGARIAWTTDEPADSLVEYGVDLSYGLSTPLDTALMTSHQFDLGGLTPATMYYFRVKSRDAAGNLATSPNGTFTTFGASTLVLSSALSDGTVGIPYNQTVTASGGTSPYTFSIVIGALPTGLALNGSTGAINGPPTNSGIASFSVKALDALGAWGIQSYTINLSTQASPNPNIFIRR